MVADDIVYISKNVHWWAKDTSRTFYSSILAEKSIKLSLEKLSGIIMGKLVGSSFLSTMLIGSVLSVIV